MTRVARFVSFLWVSLTLSSCVTPGAIEDQEWIEVTSEHFTLLSNAGEKRTAELARDLERFRAVVSKITGSVNVEPKIPTRIYVLDGLFHLFAPKQNIAGYLASTSRANYIAIDARNRSIGARGIIYHEYVHFLLRNQPGRMQYPAWYDEGLAEMLSTVREHKGNVILGMPPENIGWILGSGEHYLSLEAVATTKDFFTWPALTITAFYARSWMLTYYLHTSHLYGGPNRSDELLRYLDLVDRGMDPPDAALQAFGVSFRALEREILRFLSDRRVKALHFPVNQFPVSDRTSTRIVPTGEALYRLGDLARHAGAKKSDLATDLFRQAQAADPAYAPAYEGIPWSRAPQGDPEAQGLFSRAIELAPELPAAYAGLGAAYLAEPELDEDGLIEGLQSLEKARALLPWSSQTSVWLAGLYVRAGGDNQYQRARNLLEEVLRWSEGESALTTQARDLLAELDRLAQP